MSAPKRVQDLGIVLPVGGALLLLPPYLGIFDQPIFLAGIPLLPAYLFFVWAVGIVLAAWLARLVLKGEDTEPEGDG